MAERRSEITKAMSGGTEAPRRSQIRAALGQGKPASGAIGVSKGFQANLGQQLSSRVSSGAISQKQAQRTAGQRATFQKAFGENWRQRVFGNQAGNLGSLRKSASEGDLGSKNELGVLRERRQKLLAQARKRKPGIGPGQAA